MKTDFAQLQLLAHKYQVLANRYQDLAQKYRVALELIAELPNIYGHALDGLSNAAYIAKAALAETEKGT